MPVPDPIRELVERFELNSAAYHAGQYNEAQVRQEFINPFFAEARTPQTRRLLQQQIEITDRQIDALVYELYGLTEEEIGIVEGA